MEASPLLLATLLPWGVEAKPPLEVIEVPLFVLIAELSTLIFIEVEPFLWVVVARPLVKDWAGEVRPLLLMAIGAKLLPVVGLLV